MYLSYKYKLKLTFDQKKKLDRLFNAENFIYRWAYQKKIEYYKKYRKIYYASEMIKELQKLIENDQNFAWLNCLSSQTIFYSLYALDNTFKFQQQKFKARPTLKKYRIKRFVLNNNEVIYDFKKGNITIKNLNETLNFNYYRPLKGKYNCCTLWKYSNGDYFISFLCPSSYSTPVKQKIDKQKVIGLDLGSYNYILISSNNKKIKFPAYLEKNYQKWQKSIEILKTKQKSSKNFQKQLKKVKKLEQRFLNCRKDFYHKLSNKIINTKDIDLICFETLNYWQKIKKEPLLAKELLKTNLTQLSTILMYKCILKGKRYCTVDEYPKVHQKCRNCTFSQEETQFLERLKKCPHCNIDFESTLLTAKNIAKAGIKKCKL